ncbi:MAG: pseudouridine synthase [Nitrospinaceae bacterium]|jgi:pseudouridine synthase
MLDFQPTVLDSMTLRLQKIIANAGIASRREAERLIDEGRVSVNGTVVRQQGVLADPDADRIKVNGRLLPAPEKKVCILFNKPRGCLTTVKDDKARPTVMEFFKDLPARVYPVGRLDFNTEGVLLFTNDGDLSKKLLAPKSKVPRTYLVKVRGVPEEKALNRLRRGVRLDNRPTGPMKVHIKRTTGKNSVLSIKLAEGKYRHLKRVCEKVGHPVVKINRIEFGKLNLTGLPLGAYRFLTPKEVRSLNALIRETDKK